LACRPAGDRVGDAAAPRTFRALFAPFYPILRRHGRIAIAGGGFVLLATLAGFASPLITRFFVDEVILGRQPDLLAIAVVLLAACLAAEKLLRLAEDFCFARFEQKVLREIQEDLVARSLAMPKAFFDEHPSGYLTRRIAEDVDGLRVLFSGFAFNAAGQALRLAGGACFLLYLEWRIALAVLALLPALAWGLGFVSRKIHALSRRRLEHRAEAAGMIQESLAGSSTLKAFAAESRMRQRIMSCVDRQLQAGLEQSVIGSLSAALIQAVPGIGRALALAAGAVLVIRDEWTLGSLLAFQAYLGLVFGPAQYLSSANLQLQLARAALGRVAALFAIGAEDPQAGGIRASKLRGEIEFRGVGFCYGGRRPVLDDLSMHVHPGEAVAVMGPSGVGKSTLLSLLLLFYKPTSGEIRFDGRPAAAYDLAALRRRLGFVPQRPCLFSGSILSNLRIGRPDAPVSLVSAAAALAGIHEEVLALPNGYETPVGEGGLRLSEGQKQRLALAQALLADPDILILDEPTAALDEAAEASVLEALHQWRKGRTVIVVTHRAAAARRCDRVVALKDDRGQTESGCPAPFSTPLPMPCQIDNLHRIG
jgi:ABC-type bacteriocin/lantibiotic exporter with double-glycine peptidase domain